MLARATQSAARFINARALARSMATKAESIVPEIRKVGVIGMGLMGHGIIQVSAEAGFDVHGVDASFDSREAGMKRISSSLEKQAAKAVAKGKTTEEDAATNIQAILGRVSHGDTYDGLADCDLIIEALPENVELKREVWAKVEELLAGSSSMPILASNTSSLQLSDMAVGNPSRLVGLHFFNPVQLMRLVEVVRGDETTPDVFDTASKYVEAIGKTAVQCGDTPGFVVNRLLVPYMAQAVAMLERGDATIEGIDAAMKLGAGYPMGPFVLCDYVGLDTCDNILRGWTEKYPDEPAFIAPKLLSNMVAAGHLGRKTGRGFYHWDGDKPTGVAFEA